MAIKAWTACGVAMSMVAYTLHETCPMEIKILTGALVLFSGYMRVQLRSAEEKMEEKIEGIINNKEFVVPLVPAFRAAGRSQQQVQEFDDENSFDAAAHQQFPGLNGLRARSNSEPHRRPSSYQSIVDVF